VARKKTKQASSFAARAVFLGKLMEGQYGARLVIVSLVLALFLSVVVARLVKIQLVDGKRHAEVIRKRVEQERKIGAKRGDIYDRKGRSFTTSVPRRTSDGDLVMRRKYPKEDLAGNLIGFVGTGGLGRSGIEYTFDHHLLGVDGLRVIGKDGRQRAYKTIGLLNEEPQDGNDVYLTIDQHMQEIVQHVLRQRVRELNAKGAMAIVMEPNTGKILAMANEPSFNPNVSKPPSEDDMKNSCVSVAYEVGSTFKVITAAIALREKVVTDSTVFDCNGTLEIPGERPIKCWPPHGQEITFKRAIAMSCNVVLAQVANKFTNEQFYRHIDRFGFGAKTHERFYGEESGVLHPPDKWSGNRSRAAIGAMGYEVMATLLQMMRAYASVANGGDLLLPVISERVQTKEGRIIESAEARSPVRPVMPPEVAANLRDMMINVVESREGTAGRARMDGIRVAGKTGTSRKWDSHTKTYTDDRHWSSFIGFLPAEAPELLCGVVFDEPAGRETGGVAAAPAFKRIMEMVIAHPDLEYLKPATATGNIAGSRRTVVPEVGGLTRRGAAARLDSAKFTYTFAGDGDIVRHQAPPAGSIMRGGVVLYTDFTADSAARIVPNGVGKDMRDAFNLFNASGIPVYAVGSGFVTRQSIAPGEKAASSAVCTLYGTVVKK